MVGCWLAGAWSAVKFNVAERLTASAASGKRSTCALCGAFTFGEAAACDGCRADLPLIQAACGRCGLPAVAGTSATCGGCLAQRWRFDAAWVPFRYGFPIDRLVKSLKFSGDLAAGRELAALMTLAGAPSARPDLLAPVPLSATRLRERGFNQAREIASHLAAALEVPIFDGCDRRRDTAPQTTLAASARRANVRRAFAVGDHAALRDATVAIVDDVVTTCHTVDALAAALRRAGAARVEVWAAARAVPPR